MFKSSYLYPRKAFTQGDLDILQLYDYYYYFSFHSPTYPPGILTLIRQALTRGNIYP